MSKATPPSPSQSPPTAEPVGAAKTTTVDGIDLREILAADAAFVKTLILNAEKHEHDAILDRVVAGLALLVHLGAHGYRTGLTGRQEERAREAARSWVRGWTGDPLMPVRKGQWHFSGPWTVDLDGRPRPTPPSTWDGLGNVQILELGKAGTRVPSEVPPTGGISAAALALGRLEGTPVGDVPPEQFITGADPTDPGDVADGEHDGDDSFDFDAHMASSRVKGTALAVEVLRPLVGERLNLLAGVMMDCFAKQVPGMPSRPSPVIEPNVTAPGTYDHRYGRCVFEVVSELEDNSVQSVITSPPYLWMRDYRVAGQLGQEATWQEHLDNLVRVFTALRPKLRKSAVVFLNYDEPQDSPDGGMHQLPERLLIRLADEVGLVLRQRVVWVKTSFNPGGGGMQRVFEPIYILSVDPRTPLDYSHPIHRRVHSATNLLDIAGSVRRGDLDRADRCGRLDVGPRGTNVWDITTETRIDHECAFPVEVAERCLWIGSAVGDTVLDPFNGSGSTTAAAVRHGRHGIGIDLNPANMPVAEERVLAEIEAFSMSPARAEKHRAAARKTRRAA